MEPSRGGEEAHRARRNTRSARSPSVIATMTTLRGGRRGLLASPPTKTRRPSRRGVAMLPARRSTTKKCRGRPRCRLPVAQKCRRRDSRRQPRATRRWARARVKQLALPERTSGRSVLGGAQMSGFSTADRKFISIVRRAQMVSAGDNEIYIGSSLRGVIPYV
jgi:hypothetical protein